MFSSNRRGRVFNRAVLGHRAERVFPRMTQPRQQRGQPARPESSWYRIENLVSTQDGQTVAAVYIYDEIGWYGITAQDFVRDLLQVTADLIHLHVNSPGGDVFDGIAIYNAIRGHAAEVVVHIDGLAASAASFIAQGGDTVLIARNAQMMIHDAQGVCMGDASDMAEMATLLDKASDNIADIYTQRCGGTKKSWRKEMQGTVWYSAEEAVASGLADSVEVVGETTRNTATRVAASTRHAPQLVEPVAAAPRAGLQEDVQSDPVATVAPAMSCDLAAVAGQDAELVFDPAAFRSAVTAGLDPEPHPGFDPAAFQVLMRSVGDDAPSPPAPTPVVEPELVAPTVEPAPEPEPVVGPNPTFDPSDFASLMAGIGNDAPAPASAPAPAVSQPEPEPVAVEPEPDPVVGPKPDFDADAFRELMAGIADDAPAPPPSAPTAPAEEPRVVVVPAAAVDTEAVLADYLRAVMTDAATSVPALPDPPHETPVPPPPVQAINSTEFVRSLREAL